MSTGIARPAAGRSAAEPAGAQRSPSTRQGGLLGTLTGALLDVLVVSFACWTLTYQAALWVGWGADVTAVLSLVLAVGCCLLLLRTGRRAPRDEPGSEPAVQRRAGALPWAPLAAAVAGGAAAAVLGPWLALPRWAGVLLLAGAAAGLFHAMRRRPDGAGVHRGDAAPAGVGDELPGARWLWPVAWAWGLGLAVLAMGHRRPDADDVYFVSLATWIRERGSFPLRDTMFGEQVWPALVGHNPPVHSYEALVGTAARALGTSAPTLMFVVAVPVLAVLTAIALARLVEVARVPAPAVGLSAALVCLLASGLTNRTLGNFHVLRIWQGKAVFVAILAPLLVAAAIRYARSGSRRELVLLAAGVVSAIGLSNTTVLLLPVLLAGLVPAVWWAGGVRRVLGLAVPLAYPLAVGVAVLLAAPVSNPVPDFPLLEEQAGVPLDATREVLVAVPTGGWLGVVFAFAVAVGWLGLRDRSAQLVALGTAAAFSVAALPPVTDAIAGVTDASGVLWRLWWIVPVPLLTAGLVGVAASWWPGWRGGPRTAGALVPVVAVAVAVALLPLAGEGRWVTAASNDTFGASATDWKVHPDLQERSRLVLRAAEPGELVLAPQDVSQVVAMATSRSRPVVPRADYLAALAGFPRFYYRTRVELQQFANRGGQTAEWLQPRLETLGVRTVCMTAGRRYAARQLRELGFRRVGTERELSCFRR